ncbi:MAG: hypothetical protein H5T76_13775 [Streptomyces sp.]|nr:hypothetical protein [Streptomyces sp.]
MVSSLGVVAPGRSDGTSNTTVRVVDWVTYAVPPSIAIPLDTPTCARRDYWSSTSPVAVTRVSRPVSPVTIPRAVTSS